MPSAQGGYASEARFIQIAVAGAWAA